MKKLVPILIGICLIAFGIGFLTLKSGNNKYGIKLSNKNFSVDLGSNKIAIEEKKYNGDNENNIDIDEKATENIEEIGKIEIEVPCSNVNIISEDRDDVSVHYYGNINPNIKTKLITEKSYGKLKILIKNKKIETNNFKDIKLNLDILIPSSYTGDLDIELNVGSMTIEDLNLNKLDVESNVADVRIENVSTTKSSLESNTGNIIAKNLTGNLEAESNTGNVELEYNEFDYNIEGDVNMGNMIITLPKDANFIIDTNTNLGKTSIDFPMEISEKSKSKIRGKVGSGENRLSFSVNMGSLEIKSK